LTYFGEATKINIDIVINNLASNDSNVIDFLHPCDNIANTISILKEWQQANLPAFETTHNQTSGGILGIQQRNQRRSKVIASQKQVFSREEPNLQPLFNDIERFDNFHSYLNHELFQTPWNRNTGLNHRYNNSPPFAFFDHNKNQTRLTWCEHDHILHQTLSSHDDPAPFSKQHDDEITRKKKEKQKTTMTMTMKEDHHILWNSLRNKRILFIGDSLVRFQYLDLVYFLKYKRWNGHDNNEGLVSIYYSHYDWTSFYQLTNQFFLHDDELCECYRSKQDGVTENRKFYLPELNVTVWFIVWFGSLIYPHGHFNIAKDIQSLTCMPNRCRINNSIKETIENVHDVFAYNPRNVGQKDEFSLSGWSVNATATFIDIFIKLQKPDLVLLSTGFHGRFDGRSNFSLKEAALFSKYAKEWKEMNIHTKVIFRGTTPSIEPNYMETHADYDTLAISLASAGIWEYWNVSGEVIEKLYWAYHRIELPYVYFASDESNVTRSRGFAIDNFHYVSWVYSEMNKAFLVKYVLH
jgi:hypothetical protein